jgi:hypothetical protein
MVNGRRLMAPECLAAKELAIDLAAAKFIINVNEKQAA